ncbi:Cytochrome C oxidase, cbb3-type, subunit III [Dyadobacter koreensis]|uniref:Cytochrome C oxidase, cbb3-type, subunit III n=1 Tax=Dyadobacter koreensis TaxID=408657 RepID=A0A1H6XTZ4_9BACT|nr:c-type cytochrome [Dyadobacter koreensis]SEJ32548.1 Cytochrome C oxidase, cbb3-type, subunit III [Dyadobacter koreensis]
MKKLRYPILLIALAGTLFYCKSNKQSGTSLSATSTTEVPKTEPEQTDFSKSPFLTAEQSMKKIRIEDGFAIKLVASEPLISTPVAFSFDNKGRMWVIEMTGYMPDTVGTGEDVPNGKIVILEDKNRDGVMDDRKVFLDSLVLPRALCLIENGVLIGEPTNLWFYEIKNDKPVSKTLVDDKYTEGGNVEHQPNGLLRAMDNWIYNAKSSKRYRRKGDKWLIEQTHFRGQWGISQDNYGRLYYNNNSQNVLSDFFMPGLGATNKNQRYVAGFNEKSVANNKVYPIRPTPGVNRAYMKGVVDDSLRLVDFTAACSPLVYRGDIFGSAYESNVFVAEPSANLIKRNILNDQGYVVKGEQAYKGKEFLASTDERFRPVSLYNAPDGAMYIVDMYRGIIQHKTYLTPYLKGQIDKRDLTQPLSAGRIYKVVPKNTDPKAPALATDADGLVKLLSNKNGWIRDYAQQALVDGKMKQAIPALENAAKQTTNQLLAIHALWTLEGLDALKTDEVLALLKQSSWPIRMEALAVLPSVINEQTVKQYSSALSQMVTQNDTLSAPYIAFLANSVKPFDKAAANNLLVSVAKKYPGNKYVADAVISNLQDNEDIFKNELTASLPDSNALIQKQLGKIIAQAANARANRDPKVLLKEYPKGAALFNTVCQTCHGPDGNGVKSLGPPLNQSEWVTGDKNKLISIVLFGLTGPVKVNGHIYKTPEVSGDMPGIGYDKDMPSEDVAQLLTFIRKSWRNNGDKISTEEVASTRKKLTNRQKAFTVEELNGM